MLSSSMHEEDNVFPTDTRKHTFKESNGIHERSKCIELKYKKLDNNIEVYMHNEI